MAALVLLSPPPTAAAAIGDDHALAAQLAETSPAPAQEGLLSKLSIHGFLNQAFAIADGHQVLGITEDGTADYRSVALQFRYALTDLDQFVLQFSHEVLGKAPSNSLREDVELDWAYYARSFGTNTSVRLGRVPLPVGIFNETKDVGTLLPFFRASPSIYGDGTWTSDTIDGVVVSQVFAGSSSWALNADIYYGSWERIEGDPSINAVGLADVDNAVGTQLWLSTPVEGLRLGVGASRMDVSGGLFQPGFVSRQDNFYYSVDADFERVAVRAEYYDNHYLGGFWKALYLELLYRPTARLTLMANYDHGDLKFTIPDFAVFDDNWSKDFALGVNYKVRPDLVLKLEHHWHEGYDIEGESLNSFFQDQLKVNYAIASLAVSF
jgi:hypothetical protein